MSLRRATFREFLKEYKTCIDSLNYFSSDYCNLNLTKNFRSSIFSFLWLGETSWILAGEAVTLISKKQALLCHLHFSLWEDGDRETRGCFLFAFFFFF